MVFNNNRGNVISGQILSLLGEILNLTDKFTVSSKDKHLLHYQQAEPLVNQLIRNINHRDAHGRDEAYHDQLFKLFMGVPSKANTRPDHGQSLYLCMIGDVILKQINSPADKRTFLSGFTILYSKMKAINPKATPTKLTFFVPEFIEYYLEKEKASPTNFTKLLEPRATHALSYWLTLLNEHHDPDMYRFVLDPGFGRSVMLTVGDVVRVSSMSSDVTPALTLDYLLSFRGTKKSDQVAFLNNILAFYSRIITSNSWEVQEYLSNIAVENLIELSETILSDARLSNGSDIAALGLKETHYTIGENDDAVITDNPYILLIYTMAGVYNRRRTSAEPLPQGVVDRLCNIVLLNHDIYELTNLSMERTIGKSKKTNKTTIESTYVEYIDNSFVNSDDIRAKLEYLDFRRKSDPSLIHQDNQKESVSDVTIQNSFSI